MLGRLDSTFQQVNGGGWTAAFEAHGVDYVLLDKCGDQHLLELIRAHPGWRIDCQDEEAVLFARSDPNVKGSAEYGSI